MYSILYPCLVMSTYHVVRRRRVRRGHVRHAGAHDPEPHAHAHAHARRARRVRPAGNIGISDELLHENRFYYELRVGTEIENNCNRPFHTLYRLPADYNQLCHVWMHVWNGRLQNIWQAFPFFYYKCKLRMSKKWKVQGTNRLSTFITYT